MKKVAIYGAGPQGRIVFHTIRDGGSCSIVGFLDDDPSKKGQLMEGVPVLGGMEWFDLKADGGVEAFVAIGKNHPRMVLADAIRARGIPVGNVIHPTSFLMGHVAMGTGNLILPGAIIMTGTMLENDVVVSTGVSVDHDSVVRSGVYLSPGVRTAGKVVIGRSSFIGTGAILGPGVFIGEGSIIGAGSLVLEDVPSGVMAFGAPATVRKNLPSDMEWEKIWSRD